LTCAGLATVLLLAVATAALGATYAGRGVDDPKVRVAFEKERRAIKRFTIERARFFCTDGDRFRADTRVGRMRLDDRRRFRGRFTNADGSVSALVRGRLLGERARGRFRIVSFFDDVECRTHRVRWRARKQPPRAAASLLDSGHYESLSK
jgi:hypothetical protein